MTLKKIIEKPIKKEDIEKIKWLYSGINVLEEKARKAALEKDLEFMESKGKLMTPQEFHSTLFSKELKKELIPEKYKTEMERYKKMFVSNVADILDLNELKDAEIGKILGVPAARENLFELKKEGKRIGFVHFNEDDKQIDFIGDLQDLPKKFKEKIEE